MCQPHFCWSTHRGLITYIYQWLSFHFPSCQWNMEFGSCYELHHKVFVRQVFGDSCGCRKVLNITCTVIFHTFKYYDDIYNLDKEYVGSYIRIYLFCKIRIYNFVVKWLRKSGHKSIIYQQNLYFLSKSNVRMLVNTWVKRSCWCWYGSNKC